MSPDEIRRSWDDDDTPRSVFPEPLAERLTRENKELRAEIEWLRGELGQIADVLAARNREIAAAEARLDALVARAAAVIKAWDDFGTYEPCSDCLKSGVGLVDFDSDERMDQATDDLRAVLDKHAGEQPSDGDVARRPGHYSCGHAYREPGCGWPCCGFDDDIHDADCTCGQPIGHAGKCR